VARRDTGPRRYAEAAFEVAMRDSTLERWRADLDMAASLAGDQRALGVLANPAIAIDQRTAALDQMLGDRTSEGARNLIRLLLRRGRIEDLPRVASEFRRLDDARQGITHATATSATDLTDE
jgi:F-type H+-transporting ATPase subunit delta